MALAAEYRMSVATMGWMFKYATRAPLNAPQRQPISRPAMTQTTRGSAYSYAEVTP